MAYTEPIGFSKLDVFRECPQKFKFQFIDKLPQPSSPAMDRGSEVHSNIESYLNGWTDKLLPPADSWKDELDALKTHDTKGEQPIGLSKDWVRLPNWFDKHTWLRIKIDAYYIVPPTIYVIDFKTGKFRQPSTEQVELYALAGLSLNPAIEQAIAEMWYLDAHDVYTRVYTKDELLALRPKYENMFGTLSNNEVWNPTPSNNCRWCPYSKTKDGPCKY
jgi:CRISPR/Cas system-associated exonuclease Cas4 (RecB family)